MGDSIGCHEDFKTVQSGDEMFGHIRAPDALLSFESAVNLFDHIGQKGARSRGGIEYLDFMHLLFDAFVAVFVAFVTALRRFDGDDGFGSIG